MYDYIEIIKSKLDSISDDKLKQLIYKLIEERNYLEEISNRDSLTVLYNRRILNEIKTFGAVLVIDIDNFKTINDTYGHIVGDDVIKKVADIILKNFNSTDYICRPGGDEFIIVSQDNKVKSINAICQKIQLEIKDKIKVPSHTITISIGVAFNFNKETLTSIMKNADQALYESKKTGRNKITFYMKNEGAKENE